MNKPSPNPAEWVGTKPLKDEPIVTNERGGRQSHVPYRFDIMSPIALMNLGAILSLGAERYNDPLGDNWKKISSREHINHALVHLYQHLLNSNDGEDHIGHAFCRLMFAVHMVHTEEAEAELGLGLGPPTPPNKGVGGSWGEP
jgi:hypothetical protein